LGTALAIAQFDTVSTCVYQSSGRLNKETNSEDFVRRHAAEKVCKRKFGKQGFRPLKNWCAESGVQAPKVHDPRYGWVRSWPAAAWAAVYQIDLADLFGADGDSQ
jgi:hypothetical protein